MPPDTPPPDSGAVCRRPACTEPASGPLGFCTGHGETYATWRHERDRLEASDLAGLSYQPDDPIDAATAAALDALFLHLTPGPFTAPKRPR